MSVKTGRNDPCHCGSGKKYKLCHLPLEEAARRALPAETSANAEKTSSLPLVSDLEEGVRVLQEFRDVGDKKKKAEIERILARAAPLMAYAKRQPEIEAAAQALGLHVQEFNVFVNDVPAYQDRIEAVFAEERFIPLRWSPEDIQRAVDHSGSPVAAPKEKLVEHLRGMILYLADKNYRTSAAVTLLLSLPDYVAAGRNIDGCLVLGCARMTTATPKETNPFLWQMFAQGYQDWTAAKQARLSAQ